jgi:hypothetical protein
MITLKLQILGVSASLLLSVVVFLLLRRKKLKEKYSIFWGIVSILTVISALFFQVVIFFTDLLDIVSPINGVFFIAIFLLASLNLYFSVHLTTLFKNTKALSQENAILRQKIMEFEKRISGLEK